MTSGRNTRGSSKEADALQRRDLLLTNRESTRTKTGGSSRTRTAAAGRLSQSDDRLALSVMRGEPKKNGRKYRCSTCGTMASAEDMNPDFDEEGRRVGMICDGCY